MSAAAGNRARARGMPFMRPLRALVLAASLPLASCATEPGGVLVTFDRIGHVETVQDDELRMDGGTLVALGSFLTPCEPYSAVARADVGAQLLRLVITKKAADCPQEVSGNFAWRAVVRNLPAGAYEIRAVREYGAALPTDSTAMGSAFVP